MKRIKIKTEKLDYINPQDALLRFQDQNNLIFLDSANNTISKNNRYSYIASVSYTHLTLPTSDLV